MLAYLDPGTGSAIAMVVASGAAGATAAVKAFGSRFRRRPAPAAAAAGEATDHGEGDSTGVDDAEG